MMYKPKLDCALLSYIQRCVVAICPCEKKKRKKKTSDDEFCKLLWFFVDSLDVRRRVLFLCRATCDYYVPGGYDMGLREGMRGWKIENRNAMFSRQRLVPTA
jgi:hypothetical protein